MLKRMLSCILSAGLLWGSIAPVCARGELAAAPPETAPEEFEAETVPELLGEARSLIEEMDQTYVARYLVKAWDGGQTPRTRSSSVSSNSDFIQTVADQAQLAYEDGKAAKQQRLEAVQADPHLVEAMALTLEAPEQETVQARQLAGSYTLLTLPEKVEPQAFMEALASTVEQVEAIQPDYQISLSEADVVDPEHIAVPEPEQTPLPEQNLSPEPEQTVLPDPEQTALPEPEHTVLPELSLSQGEEVVIALIDSGVDITHPDLQGRWYVNPEEIVGDVDMDANGYAGDVCGWDFFRNSPEVYRGEDGLDQAHGTHLAGVIAAAATQAKLLPLKAFEQGTAYTSGLIEAIAYAEARGAQIVNCSWGSTDNNQALKEAMAASGMLFVCAAGNNRLALEQTPVYPACFDLDQVISVTSVNEDGGLSYFSNYGETAVNLAAWGREVESTFPEGAYGVLSGTSVSAAQVSGALASCWTERDASKERLFASADKLVNLQGYVAEGRRLNGENLRAGVVSTELQDVNPAEDFNTEGYERTPKDSWNLFSTVENIAVTAGHEFVAVLKVDGTVWTWGKNNYGQLGLGNYVSTSTPRQVPSLSGVVQIAAGEYHMAALTESGKVYTWGRNLGGALGLGTTANSTVPKVTGISGCTGIGAGSSTTYFITGTGLYVCGTNTYGQVGDGTNTDRATPVKISIAEPLKQITGGGGATFAIGQSGALYTWGDNGYGRLGDGTETQRKTPVKVISSGVKQVNMGWFDCTAAMEDGSVYNWGFGYGTVPRKDTSLTDVTKAVSGRQAQFVLQGNTIKSKGNNTFGSLGVGSTAHVSSYTPISGRFVDFAIREYWAAAIGTDGLVYTWGVTNADTSDYVTIPVQASGEINQITDVFADAADINIGSFPCSIDFKGDVNHFRFIPQQTETYRFYSKSAIDLTCRLYKVVDGAAVQYAYNDDRPAALPGQGARDFLLSAELTAGEPYYLEVRGYGDNYQGTYTLCAEPAGPNNVFEEGAFIIQYLNIRNMGSVKDKLFTVNYTSGTLALEDACVFTSDKELAAGLVPGTKITITEVSPGRVSFWVDETVPAGKLISSTLTGIRFRVTASGTQQVTCTVTQRSN